MNIESQIKSVHTLVSGESNPEKNILSIKTALGQAVHWKKEGEVVKVIFKPKLVYLEPKITEYLIEKIE